MRTATVRQKSVLLNTICRLCEDPQTLVDIYINYDCDRDSIENVYERMVNILSRIGTTQFGTTTNPVPSGSGSNSAGDIVNAPAGSGVQIGLGSSEKDPYGNMPYEHRVKRQALEALVHTLRSLVSWAGRGTNTMAASLMSSVGSVSMSEHNTPLPEKNGRISEEVRPPNNRASLSETELTRPASSASGIQTPVQDPEDDPGRFESAKQRKTTLLEGIKSFNSKPKKVSLHRQTG